MTSRKHYIEVAGMLRDVQENGAEDQAVCDAVEEIAKRLAGIYKSDNPNFDRDRFLSACGVAE